jgi:hypothetical protein
MASKGRVVPNLNSKTDGNKGKRQAFSESLTLRKLKFMT